MRHPAAGHARCRAGTGWLAAGMRIIGWRRQARSAAESEEEPGMAGLCLVEMAIRPKMRA